MMQAYNQRMSTNDVIITCNKLAMTALATEAFKECHLYLKRAEDLVRASKQKLALSNGRGG